jgi:hypothetical protein
MPEACLATIGAAGLDALKPGKFAESKSRATDRF